MTVKIYIHRCPICSKTIVSLSKRQCIINAIHHYVVHGIQMEERNIVVDEYTFDDLSK